MIDWLIRFLFPPAFEVELRDGSALGRKGTFPGGFLADCSDIAKHFDLRCGRIFGRRDRGGIALRFTRDIPPESYQRFRNLFGIYRHRFK